MPKACDKTQESVDICKEYMLRTAKPCALRTHNHNRTERAVVAILHGFQLAFTKSFASLISCVVNKPNTQLKSDANDFVKC